MTCRIHSPLPPTGERGYISTEIGHIAEHPRLCQPQNALTATILRTIELATDCRTTRTKPTVHKRTCRASELKDSKNAESHAMGESGYSLRWEMICPHIGAAKHGMRPTNRRLRLDVLGVADADLGRSIFNHGLGDSPLKAQVACKRPGPDGPSWCSCRSSW